MLLQQKFASKIRVYAFLVEYETRMKIAYEIYDITSGKILNKAHTVQVAVGLQSEEMLYESPSVFIEKSEDAYTSSRQRCSSQPNQG